MAFPVAPCLSRAVGTGDTVSRTLGVLFAIVLLSGSATAGHLKELRVCGDPDNLPYSNDKQEGFENRIAEVVARDLGLSLAYYWWPHQRGLVRNTLRAEKCDVLIGIPKGYDPVLWTKPYYRSTHALVYVSGRGLNIRSLDDPVLRQLRIGVHRGAPPHDVLAERGILANVVSYSLFHDPRGSDPDLRPTKPVEDVITGTLDAAIVWGPWAGYFVKKRGVSTLEVVPLSDSGPVPLSFEISMGVKKGERELKGELEASLVRRQAEIAKILDDYGVPRLALTAGSGPPGPGPGGAAAPGSHTHSP
jgi:mxaJ protein